jgi:8-oxo-dGTP pyrophosphatase MutT (NUDIX family)
VRKDNGLICGPGGHIEAGEAPIQAAIRETQEEFGITPLSLSRLGTIGINVKSADAHCTEVFVCTEFSGRPKADNEEMCGALFVPHETLCEEFADSLFPPFKDSLLEFQKTELFVQLFDVEKSKNDDIIKLSEAQEDGGPGSGNFGHGGRPGKLGGSAPVSGSVGRMAQNKTWQKAKSVAEEKCKSVFRKTPSAVRERTTREKRSGLQFRLRKRSSFITMFQAANSKALRS